MIPKDAIELGERFDTANRDNWSLPPNLKSSQRIYNLQFDLGRRDLDSTKQYSEAKMKEPFFLEKIRCQSNSL
jgi:hypothetical protein